jgi:hypothetical protein
MRLAFIEDSDLESGSMQSIQIVKSNDSNAFKIAFS